MTTDEKLDYLIVKVNNLEREIQEIKATNDKHGYSLESKFYDIFSSLRDTITKMDSANYGYYSNLDRTIRNVESRNTSLERKVEKLEEHTPLNRFVEKIIPWTPAILISGAVWSMVIYIILNN